jgi:hypothetical protein
VGRRSKDKKPAGSGFGGVEILADKLLELKKRYTYLNLIILIVMFFKKLFKKVKEETPEEMLRRLKPELFDETGKIYNGGIFNDSPNAYKLSAHDIELFPEFDKVFNEDSELELSFFLPLCSINLQIVNKSWSGKAHFIHLYKSQSDKVDSNSLINEYGDYNVTLFTSYGETISYNGDNKAFELTNDELSYWEKVRLNYKRNKELKDSNFDQFLNQRRITIESIVRQVGDSPMWVQSDETPNSNNGEEIFFIGQLNVNSLIDEGGWIFLFYCPQKELLIQVEQWT